MWQTATDRGGIVLAMATKRRDIFDTGAAPPKATPDRGAEVPDGAWVPSPPVIEDELDAPAFDEAADDIQRRASGNRAHYVHELELIAIAWRKDTSLIATSARAAMQLLALAGGSPEKRVRVPHDPDDGADTDVPEWTPRVRRE